jgi:uncharacterized membrane protein
VSVAEVGAVWLHVVATVVLIGYYTVLGFLVLPVLRRTVAVGDLCESIAAVERRALPVLVGSVIVFLATGVYLMGIDPKYGGVGNVTGSTWATLFLVKHLLVVGFVGLGLFVDAIIVRGGTATDPEGQAAVVRRVSLACQAMALLGAVILLVTAAAQAS